MFFDDLKEEQKVTFMSELRKYYPKREVDLRSLFIKVVEIDNDCEFYIENES